MEKYLQNIQITTVAAEAFPVSPVKVPAQTHSLPSLLMYGGTAVAVIWAMTYFTQTFFKGINTLAKTLNKKASEED